jgi:hypothetical protein
MLRFLTVSRLAMSAYIYFEIGSSIQIQYNWKERAACANAYEIFGVVLHDGEAIHGLWQYLYFSVVTFTTLGYGDYVPAGISQGISAFQALLGFGYFAFVIGVSGSPFYARINKL